MFFFWNTGEGIKLFVLSLSRMLPCGKPTLHVIMSSGIAGESKSKHWYSYIIMLQSSGKMSILECVRYLADPVKPRLFSCSTDSFSNSAYSSRSSNHFPTQTVKARELKFWESFDPPPCVTFHVSHVSCHMSCIMCHMSCVKCQMSNVLII